ncbi:pyridoxal phosphate-dependent transferase [Mycena latifolia]|nr:pyridoxal phosphate-dependent transferase [Mycena latifolia]
MSSNPSFKLRGVLNTISPPIPLAYTWTTKYILAQSPLLDMSQGVPGAPPQKSLQEALGRASFSLGSFGYCPFEGELALRQEMVDEMRVVYGGNIDVKPEDLSLTSGYNFAFLMWDEVILPVPWFVLDSLWPFAMLNIARPEDGFTPSVSDCTALITPKTRAIVLITPNNPTGATYSPELIADFARLADKKEVALVIDETYRDFVTTELPPPYSLFSQASWRTHFVQLFSRGFAGVHKALGTILDSLQIYPPRPIQLALTPILGFLRAGIIQTALDVQARRELFKQHLPAGGRIGSIGGYFAFVRHPFPGRGSLEVCQQLAEELGVMLLPAAFFYPEVDQETNRWIRFSVANCDDEKVRQVCARLERCEAVFGWQKEA